MPGNSFQRRLTGRLRDVLAARGIEPHEAWCDYRRDPADPADRGAYMRLLFRVEGVLCEAWAYVDEAAFSIAGNWYTFEERRFAGEDDLLAAAVEFVERWTSGENPVDAYRTAARIAGRPSRPDRPRSPESR